MAARAPVSACRPQSMMKRPLALGRIDPNRERPSASTSEQLGVIGVDHGDRRRLRCRDRNVDARRDH